MNLALGLLSLGIIALYTLIDILFTGKLMIIKNTAVGVAYFMISFMVVSLTAFVFDNYSLFLTYIIITVIAVAALVLIFCVKYKSIKALLSGLERVRYFPLALILILFGGCFFTFLKFDLFGMGQDQGVYQQSALLMTEGINSRFIPIKEYDLLTNDEDRETFKEVMDEDMLATVGGFYSIRVNTDRGTLSPEDFLDNVAMFHALPNLPALLSATGKILGSEHIMHALTLPYLAAITLIFITLNVNLGVRVSAASIATAVFTVSPVVLWTTKAALTEIYLAMLISLFLYLLTSKEKKHSFLLSVPVLGFAFFHISIFAIMPMFIILFAAFAIYKRDFGAWVSGVLSTVFYCLGFVVACWVAPRYTFEGYARLIGIFNTLGINVERDISLFMPVFSVLFVTIILFILIYVFIFKKGKTPPDIRKYVSYIIATAVILCLSYICYKWYVLTTLRPGNSAYSHHHGGNIIELIPNLTLFAYLFGTGFVLVIVILSHLLKRKEYLYKDNTLPLVFLFVYTVLIYSAFLIFDTFYYYYFSRYIVSYMPIVIVLGGIVVDRFKYKLLFSAFTFVLMLPFSLTLAFNKDISYIDIKSKEAVIEKVQSFDDGSIVVLENNMAWYFLNDISALSNSNVYSQMMIDKINDISFMDGRNIYLISRDEKNKEIYGASIYDTNISSSHFVPWFTGWGDRGPANLLRPIKDEYTISIYDVSDCYR